MSSQLRVYGVFGSTFFLQKKFETSKSVGGIDLGFLGRGATSINRSVCPNGWPAGWLAGWLSV